MTVCVSGNWPTYKSRVLQVRTVAPHSADPVAYLPPGRNFIFILETPAHRCGRECPISPQKCCRALGPDVRTYEVRHRTPQKSIVTSRWAGFK